MKYGGGMNELPYPSDLTAAQWALIEPLLPAPKPKGRKRRVDLRKITNAILYVPKAASVGACCRVNLLPGRPCTITFVFGGSPGSGTGFMINSGIRYALAKADIFVRAQQLWTAKAWQRSKRGRSGLRCCEAHQGS